MTDHVSEPGEQQLARYEADRATLLEANGGYDITAQHDACGVGLVCAIDGKPRREVVELAIRALKAIWHRGAVDADGKTGDGAGVLLSVPQDFFADQITRIGHTVRPGPIAVGQVFLPRTDLAAQEAARTIVEAEALRFGFYIYGWRQVPTDNRVIGEKANATPSRDRADHALAAQGPGRRGAGARPVPLPPADRKARGRGQHPALLHLLPVGQVADLQGHVPRRAH